MQTAVGGRRRRGRRAASDRRRHAPTRAGATRPRCRRPRRRPTYDRGRRPAQHVRADHDATTTSTSSASRRAIRRSNAGRADGQALDGQGRRPGRQAGQLRRRGPRRTSSSSKSASIASAASRRWSMVIPWIGVPLAGGAEQGRSRSRRAKFVEFTTLRAAERDARASGPRALDWPYVEGLRMDEAMHPLTFMVVGLYGKVLPNQNGAPLRAAHARGSTASRAASRSSASASPTSSRERPGPCRRRTSTASTRT